MVIIVAIAIASLSLVQHSSLGTDAQVTTPGLRYWHGGIFTIIHDLSTGRGLQVQNMILESEIEKLKRHTPSRTQDLLTQEDRINEKK